MKSLPRPLGLVPCLALVVGILNLSQVAFSQTQDKPSPTGNGQAPSAPQKPVHKPDAVASNDPIVRLADHPSAHPQQPAAPESAPAASKPDSTLPTDPAQRKAAIASLEQQIKDKQRRVELLMRLFVTDEKSFVKDPLNPDEDAATQERRRYEQDELHRESAEVARLQARLNQLKALPSP